MRFTPFLGKLLIPVLFTVVFIAFLFPDLAYGAEKPDDTGLQVSRLWVLIATALVFFMQTGFLALEAGMVRARAAPITAMKNVGDWMVCAVFFFFFGWATMFGHTAFGYMGADGFSLNIDTTKGWVGGIWIHFLFQLAFAGTAATIVSGALAERTGFIAYLICSAVISAIIYPVFGHWAWGNSFFSENKTLLTEIGFLDFAGSTVVHSVGGWVALVGVIMVGPRLGRFGKDGKVQPMVHHSLAMSAKGVLILWLGWWGFNGGSTMAFNDDVGAIINNTNLGAAVGGLSALLHCAAFQRKREITTKFLSGILGGLVSVTAGCNIITPLDAVVIGFVAGIICNVATELMLKWKLDDPVSAVPVHLFCGIWGTLCVALFGDMSQFPQEHSRVEQLSVQAIGVFACGVWTLLTSFLMFAILKQMGLRVSPEEELQGYDVGGVAAIRHMASTGDHVVVEKAGGYNIVDTNKFMAMAAKDKEKLITDGKVQFIKNGQVLTPEEALNGAKPHGYLQVVEGAHVGRRVALVAKITRLGKTGKLAGTITLAADGRYILQTLKGAEGTKLNGVVIPPDGAELKHDDLIEFADTCLQFVKLPS